jgi:hypothetical protein
MSDMFSGCSNLNTIYSPKNVGCDVDLPTTDDYAWCLPNGTVVTELPLGLSDSVLIEKKYVPTEDAGVSDTENTDTSAGDTEDTSVDTSTGDDTAVGTDTTNPGTGETDTDTTNPGTGTDTSDTTVNTPTAGSDTNNTDATNPVTGTTDTTTPSTGTDTTTPTTGNDTNNTDTTNPATGTTGTDATGTDITTPTTGSNTATIDTTQTTEKTELTTQNTTVKLSKSSYTYDGKAKRPTVTVKDSDGNTIDSKYYTVIYKNNKKVGTATVTITFKDDYTGTVEATFKINPKATLLKKVASAKTKTAKVTWKKQATQTTGYEIQYSTSTKFTKKATKTATVKSAKTTSTTVKKLSAKKKYYVRIRTYKTVGGKKYYSDWSKVMSVKTK